MKGPLAIIFALFILLSLFAVPTGSQEALEIKINEVCTSNLCSSFDEYGGTPDWIELYNPNDRAVDLTGWHLSDSEKRLDK
ncbi:MAG: lamin tail domain-containing protein, partial [Lachnospiraceae bacterium]|nr:lamin tail domain-containing protein [Lachnospiraceae bacterium]